MFVHRKFFYLLLSILYLVIGNKGYASNFEFIDLESLEYHASTGNPSAQYELSIRHKKALNLELSFFWCNEAANLGLVEAQSDLSDKYQMGEGVKKNEQYALCWYEKVAEQGLIEAQYNMGYKYDNGEGVVENSELAFYWYMRAAQQCDNQAQYAVGNMFEHGEGVNKDLPLAYQWYELSAYQGNDDAQASLKRLQNTMNFIGSIQ